MYNRRPQANTNPEQKFSVLYTFLPLIAPVKTRTYQAKSFWNTPSPAMQNSEHNAFSRDLVVLDCQPPSKIVIVVSSTMAILLPWRYTVDTPSLVTTSVLPERQFLFALIAAFICCSILRMESCGLLNLIVGYTVWGTDQPMLCQFAHWSANMPSWASRTKSITSSVADTLKRSQYQSTAISADAMVSNM